MVIFDCNDVLVDSEPIVSAVLAESLTRAGFPANSDGLARRYHGRRPADVFASVEAATGKKLPPNFATGVAVETLRRFRTELRALPHVAHALTWVRGPKAVASSSPHDRLRAGLEAAGLLRFFEQRLFSASDVPNGARSVPFRRRADAGRSGVLHRHRGFGARRRRRGRGRNDGDRFCRQPSNAGPARP
ncbi:MAG TPA: HAD family hydrolase [Xanthobacteraceae bacterium]|jgi:beta-phosphoglucomutase-like phosphatase (HAD superfamily)|nr:HAD family hydrolase [Xanthobacteraceae bacterium]